MVEEVWLRIPDLTSTNYKLRQLANYFAIRYKEISKCSKEGHIKGQKSTYVCNRCGITVHPPRTHTKGTTSKIRKLRIKISDILNSDELRTDELRKYKLTESEINLVWHKLRRGDFKVVSGGET